MPWDGDRQKVSRLKIPQTEAEFQKVVTDYAEKQGWHWMHIGRVGKYAANGAKGTLGRGWPDLLLVRGRRLIFAELKAQNGELPQHQRDVLAVLHAVSGEAYVWRPSDLPFILEELA